MKRSFVGLALFATLAALPASAAAPIASGTDLWVTAGDGRTYTDFAANPIPSGFFCNRSEAFAGRIAFKGVPLATDEPELMRGADTIIHRLDDAAFDRKGVAATRIQVRALNLVSMQPVQTACGAYNVRATLAGDQPVTSMRIYRTTLDGGNFLAPLGLNVKLTFTPVAGGRALSVTQPIRFPANPRSPWIETQQEKGASVRYMRVDTNGDGRPDTFLPGPSNFRPLGTSFEDKLLAPEACLSEAPLTYEPSRVGDKVVTTCQQAHTAPGHTHYVAPPPPSNPCGGSGFTLQAYREPCQLQPID